MATKKDVKKVKKAAKKVVKKAKLVVKAKETQSISSIKKPFTKSEIASFIAGEAGVEKKQAASALDALAQIINAHISKKGPGVFVFPGLVKFKVVRKPATKAWKGVNPFTKEPMTFAAKPARNIVKIRPLKKLKDIAK